MASARPSSCCTTAERVGLPLEGTAIVLSGGVLTHPSTLLVDAIMRRLPGSVAVRNGTPPIVGAVLLALDRLGAAGDAVDLAQQITTTGAEDAAVA